MPLSAIDLNFPLTNFENFDINFSYLSALFRNLKLLYFKGNRKFNK